MERGDQRVGCGAADGGPDPSRLAHEGDGRIHRQQTDCHIGVDDYDADGRSRSRHVLTRDLADVFSSLKRTATKNGQNADLNPADYAAGDDGMRNVRSRSKSTVQRPVRRICPAAS